MMPGFSRNWLRTSTTTCAAARPTARIASELNRNAIVPPASSPTSTSGWLFPLAKLTEEGVVPKGADPKTVFSDVLFAGGYAIGFFLAAWGVQRLLLNHPLDPPQPRARVIAQIPSFGQTLYIHEIVDHAPLAFLARRVIRAPHLNAAYQTLSRPGFDARVDAVVPGEGPPSPRSGGRVRMLREGPERMELEVEAGPGGGLLVVQRSIHLWEAEIDGNPAEVVPANLYRLGLEVPAGRHRVVFTIDRAPLVRSSWGVVAGLALLPMLGLWGAAKQGRRRPM